MAGKQISGDGLASNLAGMSKSQLYDIMCQMKSLIEQNQQQARKILIQNPLLTRALFQAQIMLGMVQAPQATMTQVQSVQPQAPQPSPPVQQAAPVAQSTTTKQVGFTDQANVSQAQAPPRKQQQNQPSLPITSTPAQGISSQSMPPQVPPQVVEQHRGPLNTQANQLPHPQSSQVPNMPPLPMHTGSQPPPVHQPPMPPVPGHLQQPMQTTGASHHLLQPPLPPQPPQPRPPMQMQYQPPIGTNMNFQNSGFPHMHHSQPMFHTNSRPSSGMGPYPQGQPPLPHQQPHQSQYQSGGSHMSGDYQNAGNLQMERPSGPSPWPPVSRESTTGAQLPAPPSLGPGQLPVGNQPPRPPPLTPEVEHQLLQQVMSLTPEQINLLPPEQRHQVLQLQQMLRQ
ncbi:Cleavage stimulating factor 64 [Bienertia sinuspersici]